MPRVNGTRYIYSVKESSNTLDNFLHKIIEFVYDIIRHVRNEYKGTLTLYVKSRRIIFVVYFVRIIMFIFTRLNKKNTHMFA